MGTAGTSQRPGPTPSASRGWTGRRTPVVLMYHGFAGEPMADDPENLFVTVDALEAQMDHLLAHGWEPLDLDGYLKACRGRGRPRGKSFLVTVDDGFGSVASLAAPVLAARSIPFLLFVPAGLLGQTAWWLPEPPNTPLMSAAALRELVAQAPVEIGGHGYDHIHMLDLVPDELHRQTAEVRSILAAATASPVRAFAYPYGSNDASSRRAVEDAGYEVAFSVFRDAGPHAISRVDVNATDTLASFRLKLIPGYRTWWHWLDKARPLRRGVRRVLSAASRRD